MTMTPVTEKTLPLFRQLCAKEHLFGSRSLCAYLAGTANSFLLSGASPAALSLSGGILTVVFEDLPNVAALEEWIAKQPEVVEINSTLALCTQLQARLGGKLESSFFMRCDVSVVPEMDPTIRVVSNPPLVDVFSILQNSHPHYREHLQFAPWSAKLQRWLELGLSELYALEVEGRLVGTGRIVSQDDTTAGIGGVAVLPDYRNRGYGRQLSAFLTRRVQEMGKTPVLISGYDAVACLYRSIGYHETGRWGELYLDHCR